MMGNGPVRAAANSGRENVTIHPSAIVEPGAQLGVGVSIGPFCHVGPKVALGDGCSLHSHVVVSGRTTIGAKSTVHPFTVLGGPPQHLAHKGEETVLEIGEGNVIREHVSMHTGTVSGGGVTRVGANGLYMANSHVAHDCQFGDNVILANGAAVGGHVAIGDFVFLGGLCALHQFTRIGDYAFIGGGSIVVSDVIPYGSVFGNRAVLNGLNIVGMKRRGIEKSRIHEVRAAYRGLFASDGSFNERVQNVEHAYRHIPEVKRILDFIAAESKRPLMAPGR